jgi:DNA-binding NarL/FixJ family response regulator
MTRVVVVADSGAALAALTAAVETVEAAYIVRHACGRSALDRLLAALAPDLVVIGDLGSAELALARLAEARRAAPAAKVVVLSDRPEAAWLADALRADAAAVLPGNLDARTLGVVLREVLAKPVRSAGVASVPPARPLPRITPARRRRGRRRGQEIKTAQEETAA